MTLGPRRSARTSAAPRAADTIFAFGCPLLVLVAQRVHLDGEVLRCRRIDLDRALRLVLCIHDGLLHPIEQLENRALRIRQGAQLILELADPATALGDLFLTLERRARACRLCQRQGLSLEPLDLLQQQIVLAGWRRWREDRSGALDAQTGPRLTFAFPVAA